MNSKGRFCIGKTGFFCKLPLYGENMKEQTGRDVFDFGRVFQRVIANFKVIFTKYYIWAIVLVGVPAMLVPFTYQIFNFLKNVFGVSVFEHLGNDPFSGLSLMFDFFGFTLQAFLWGMLFYASISTFSGQQIEIRESFKASKSVYWRLLISYILSALGIFLGLIFFLIPGLWLLCMWAVIGPVLVIEKQSITSAFGRSVELTNGYKWWVFLIIVFLTLMSEFLTFTLRYFLHLVGVADKSTGGDFIVVGTVNAVYFIFVKMVEAITVASLYYELRLVKEGGMESIYSVFD